MMRRACTKIWLLLAILLLLLAACRGSVVSDDGALSTQSAEESAVLIRYERSGGVMGRTESWTIAANGRITNDTEQSLSVTPTAVTELYDTLVASDFFTLESSYLPADTCCDRSSYTLTVRRPDGTLHQVSAMDGANAPETLWQSLDRVQRLLAEAQE